MRFGKVTGCGRATVTTCRSPNVHEQIRHATHLSPDRSPREIGATPPVWAWHDSRKLHAPWLAHPGAALRATLLAESPAPFRERNLFVSANALTRA